MKEIQNVSCETLSEILLDKGLYTDKDLSLSFSERIFDYWKEFEIWNRTHNLSSINDIFEALHLHFLDSLFPVLFPSAFQNAEDILDLGSGGGFPGIPLSLYFPHINFHLLDKSRKKTSFLRYTSSKLNFKNVSSVHGDFFNHLKIYNVIISRAVRIDSAIYSHASKCISKNGWLIIYRTKDDLPELKVQPTHIIDYTILNKNRSVLFYQF